VWISVAVLRIFISIRMCEQSSFLLHDVWTISLVLFFLLHRLWQTIKYGTVFGFLPYISEVFKLILLKVVTSAFSTCPLSVCHSSGHSHILSLSIHMPWLASTVVLISTAFHLNILIQLPLSFIPVMLVSSLQSFWLCLCSCSENSVI
jgi:hypothetical protein